MITGTMGGSGKYSFRENSSGSKSVLVAHMPENNDVIRIIFRHDGEETIKIQTSEREAILLLASLKTMAEDLNWDDRTMSEISEGLVYKRCSRCSHKYKVHESNIKKLTLCPKCSEKEV